MINPAVFDQLMLIDRQDYSRVLLSMQKEIAEKGSNLIFFDHSPSLNFQIAPYKFFEVETFNTSCFDFIQFHFLSCHSETSQFFPFILSDIKLKIERCSVCFFPGICLGITFHCQTFPCPFSSFKVFFSILCLITFQKVQQTDLKAPFSIYGLILKTQLGFCYKYQGIGQKGGSGVVSI